MASRSPSFFAVEHTSNPYARKPSLENARRSACDRCRAHKLRCVRPVAVAVAVDDAASSLASRNDTTLTPCERCVKAGVECVRLARGRRSPAIRQSGYERRLARPSPLSPTAFNQAPVSRHVAVPGSGGKVSVYHDSSAPLSVFPSPLSAHAPREDCTSSQMQSAMSAAMDYQHHDSLFEAGSAADAHAMSGEFPSSLLQTSGGQRGGHDVSYGLSELELDMMASSSPLGGGGGGIPNDMPSSNPLREPPESGLDRARNCGQPVGQNDKTMTPMECLQAAGPPRTKHECLRRLSGLTMKLLDCLSAAEDHPITLQDILAYKSAPPTPGTGAGAGTGHELTPCKNIIGFLLESSQDFLDAVEGLRDLMERQDRESSYDSYPNSDYSAADSHDTPVFLDGEPLARTQNDDRDTTYSQFSGTTLHTSSASAGDTAAAAAAAPPPPRQPGGVSPRQGGYCSGPTTLTIMTCYLWLFHGYEAVFAAIHDALVAQNQQRLDRRGSHTRHHHHHSHQEHRRAGEAHDTQQQQQQQQRPGFLPLKSSKAADLAPTLLPDLRIGGFHLDGHHHLQIEMLIYLSCRILRQMETALGIDARPAAAAAAAAEAEADPPQPPPTTTTGKHPAEAGGVSATHTHHRQRERSFLDPRCTSGFLRSFLCASSPSSSASAAAAVDSSAEDDGRDDQVGRGGSSARSTLIDGRVQKIRRILDII
ncbi:Cytochalasin cluster regulator ccsR [Colletotrichum spinosum]|uniref:Cytochalasin cluster regulator ccsR n=1 Tax=Colletotrichum spinosum TaxID=1347390 RepID=A0A4R8Q358_9PEZI|nr:Cytochalasin cluster regulator ccsR [Colletotrichum spinosum]